MLMATKIKLKATGIGSLLLALPLLTGCNNDAGAVNAPVVSDTVTTESNIVEAETSDPVFPLPEPDADIYVNPADVVAEWASWNDLENPVIRFNADGTGEFLSEFEVADGFSLERIATITDNRSMTRGRDSWQYEEQMAVIHPNTAFTWQENGTIQDSNGGFWRFYFHNDGHLALFYRTQLLEATVTPSAWGQDPFVCNTTVFECSVRGIWQTEVIGDIATNIKTWDLRLEEAQIDGRQRSNLNWSLDFSWEGGGGGGTASGFDIPAFTELADSSNISELAVFVEPDGNLGIYTQPMNQRINFNFLAPTEPIESRQVGDNLGIGSQIEIGGTEITFSSANFGLASQSEVDELSRNAIRGFTVGDPWLQVTIGESGWNTPEFIAADGTVIPGRSIWVGEIFIFNLAGIENPEAGIIKLQIGNEYAIFNLTDAGRSDDGIIWPISD